MLDLVLKTSNSARLVLLKPNEHCAKNNDDDDVQDHMFRFIPLKEVDRSKTIGEVETPKVAQKHTCSFCAVTKPWTEMSP